MTAFGVAGHRVLTDLERVEEGVDRALDRIEDRFPTRPLLAICSLAEGADRLVANRALMRPATRLVVPLPLPVAEYLLDFESQQSRDEFTRLLALAHRVVELPPPASRDDRYVAAGAYVVQNSDALLAVWDGRAAQGRGGTGTVVEKARHRGMPIAWVHAGNRSPETGDPTTLGDDQGRLTLERF